jgi:hypothetical protein
VVIAFSVICFGLFISSICSITKFYVERRIPRRQIKVAEEVMRGAQPSLGTAERAYPKEVLATMAEVKRCLETGSTKHEAALWEFGNAIGESCLRKGYLEGVKTGAIPDGKIRIEVTLNELLQMSWLAHLGFQHMMPNFRGVEIHRFSGEDDAREAARSVAMLECALPKSERPFADIKVQILTRDKMISDWWVPKAQLKSA